MDIKLIFLKIFLYIVYQYVNAEIILNAIAFAPIKQLEISSTMINKFNEYSKQNNLNITINLNLITPSNSSSTTDDFYFELDTILERKQDKYDLIFYNNVYTPRFEPHFLDLNNWIPESHIQLFKDINSEFYTYKNKLIGIPFYILYSVIYYNRELLIKYNKPKPKTWEELIEIGKYIIQQENMQGNTELLTYSGAFSYDEIGMSSIYEFIYSFRDNINDPFPDLRSKNAINALKMMKKIKKEISSDKYFQDIFYCFPKLVDGNALFIKVNHLKYSQNKVFSTMILPGKKEGISGTFVGGDNIGINNYISNAKKEASVKALMFLTSKDIQREIVINNNIFSGISSLYDEKEICDIENICEIFKTVQPIAKPSSKTNDYYQYSERFRYYVYKYLYGDDSVDPGKMLRKIDDITRVHYISINSKYSNKGKIIATIYLLLAFIIILSSLFLFIKKYKYNFNFLSKEYWILSLIGYILLIYISFLDLEKVSVFKCHLKILFQFISFSFIFIPVLHKLISNFPEENKYSYWINKHTKLFISIFIIIDLIIYVLMFIQPYKIENIIVTNDKNFQRCKLGGIFSRLLLAVNIVIKYLIFLVILFLLFVEWNLKSLLNDIRFCSYTIFIDALLIIIMDIFELIDIKNYTTYFSTRELLIIIFVITNYIFFYLVRIFMTNFNNKYDDSCMENFDISTIDSTPSYLRKFSYDSELINTTDNNLKSKIDDNGNNVSHKKWYDFLEYHYRNKIVSTKHKNHKTSLINIHNNGIKSSRSYLNRISLSRNYYSAIYSAKSYNNSIILSKNDNNKIQSNNELLNDEISSSEDFLNNEMDITSSNVKLLSNNSNDNVQSSNSMNKNDDNDDIDNKK